MTYDAWSAFDRHEIAASSSSEPAYGVGLPCLLAALGHAPDAAECARLESWGSRRVREGASLFHQGAPATAVHLVHAGTFKCVRTAPDGYEQVLEFGGRGEVLGFDALHAGVHPTSAVALEDARVHTIPWTTVMARGHELPVLVRSIQVALSRQMARRADTADMMAAVSAEVRLARFLLQISERHATLGLSARRFVLRMSRRDIASHLGVAHETVSRSFTELACHGYVRVRNRDVRIVDLAGLTACGRSTRGPVPTRPRPTQEMPLELGATVFA